MKKWLLFFLFIAIAAFSAVLAWRLSTDALALVAGVLLGLLALIPTVGLAALLLRGRLGGGAADAPAAPAYQPPVIIVSGGYQPMPAPPAMPLANQNVLPPPPAAQQRQFRVMGYEPAETVDLRDDEWRAYNR